MKITKKKVLSLSVIGLAIGYVFSEPMLFHICRETYTFGNNIRCSDEFPGMIVTLLYVFLPIFLISLITYKLREEVFRSWLHFAYWWVPLSVLFISVDMTGGSGGFGMGGSGELAAFIFLSLFLIISIFIIVVKSLTLRGK